MQWSDSKKKYTCVYISVFFISLALIAYQVLLIQILSIIQWHHFVYLVISICLLGFGIAGSILSVFRRFIIRNANFLLPLLCFLCSLTMVLNSFFFQQKNLVFDSYVLFSNYRNICSFVVTVVMVLLPFISGSLFIGIVFVTLNNKIGKVYCLNLLGSASGSISAFILAWYIEPLDASFLISGLIALIAALLTNKNKFIFILSLLLFCFSVYASFVLDNKLILSENKSLAKSLNIPDSKIVETNTSPYGQVTIVVSNSFRSSLCTSLQYKGAIPIVKLLFINGNFASEINDHTKENELEFYKYTTKSLPYNIRKINSVLLLNAYSSTDISVSIANKASSIDIVEQNPFLFKLIKKLFNNKNRSSTFEVFKEGLRSFLFNNQKKYDLIVLPTVNSFGDNTGLNSVQSEYNLTLEALTLYWKILSEDGMITVNCWQEYPPRSSFKVLNTLLEVLKNLGVKDPRKHIIAVKSWGDITFILSKSDFSKNDINKTISFCNYLNFEPIIITGAGMDNNGSFASALNKIFSSNRKFGDDYPLNIIPTTDNRPYFSQYLKLSFIPEFFKMYWNNNISFTETGYLIILFTLILLSLMSLLLIVLPLLFKGIKINNKAKTFFYFFSLGTAYMFVELVFIHLLNLYFENIVFSTVFVISTMLISSGFGSYYADRKYSINKKILIILIAILIVYGLLFNNFLSSTIGYIHTVKLFLSILLICIPAYIMGMPFPIGLKKFSNKSPDSIAWGWCINSCFSVISPSIAILLSIEMGFNCVLFLAACLYLIPAYLLFSFKN